MFYKIAPDKKKHLIVGIPLGILLPFLASFVFPAQPGYVLITSILALIIICYGFELFSKITGRGHADNMDAIAGIVGGLIGIGIYWVSASLLA